MQWEFIVALLLAIPIIGFPVLLWYLDIGGRYAAITKARKRRAARREKESTAEAGQREAVGPRPK